MPWAASGSQVFGGISAANFSDLTIKKRDLGSLSYYVVFCFVLSSLSPSSSWGACAGLPRPDLGWCPSVGVRVLGEEEEKGAWPVTHATGHAPFSSSSPPSSSPSWGACAGLQLPDLGWCPSVGVRVLLATLLSLLLLLLLRPLLGVRVLVYHVLTWGGVPVSGCVCCWPRPFLFSFCFLFFFFFFLFFFFFFVVSPLLSLSSSRGACAGLPRPDLGWCPSVGVRVLLATSLSLLLLFSLLLLLLLLLLPLFLLVPLCRVSPSVPLSSSWGACAGLPRPDLGWCPSVGVRVLLATSLSLLLLFSLLLLLLLPLLLLLCRVSPSVPLLFLGCVCWFTTS